MARLGKDDYSSVILTQHPTSDDGPFMIGVVVEKQVRFGAQKRKTACARSLMTLQLVTHQVRSIRNAQVSCLCIFAELLLRLHSQRITSRLQ